MTDSPFGSDTLAIPAYLAKGDGADDPGLARWKAEHPDWFVAGTWTPAPRRRPVPPTVGHQRASLPPAAVAELAAAPLPSLDPATLSVADFRRIADSARAAPQPAEPNQEPSPTPKRASESFTPAASDLAYPDIPSPGSIPNVRATTGYIFRLPSEEPIPDNTRTQGKKLLSPTGFVMTPFPDTAPEVAAAGRRAGQELSRGLGAYTPDMPPFTNMSQDMVNFIALTGMAVGQGGAYDYQREGNRITGFKQHPQFRPISNFNVGLFCQQAGLSLSETLNIAGQYASLLSINKDETKDHGLDEYTADLIRKGWQAGQTGVYSIEHRP